MAEDEAAISTSAILSGRSYQLSFHFVRGEFLRPGNLVGINVRSDNGQECGICNPQDCWTGTASQGISFRFLELKKIKSNEWSVNSRTMGKKAFKGLMSRVSEWWEEGMLWMLTRWKFFFTQLLLSDQRRLQNYPCKFLRAVTKLFSELLTASWVQTVWISIPKHEQ